jgi:hypothetical protein
MTPKERLTRLFQGREIDRIPIWLLFPYHPLGFYADVYRIPSYRRVLDAAERYADVFDRRVFEAGFCMSASPEIRHTHEVIQRGARTVKRHSVRWRDVELVEETETGGGESPRVKRLVETVADLDAIVSMPYVPPEPDLSAFPREREELGERGLMMASTGDPLGILHGLISTETLALWSITEKPGLLRFLDAMYERYLRYYTYLLEQGIGPVYFVVGTEFAGPPMVSPQSFLDLSVRHVKGIIDLIRSYGQWSIIHYHGHLKYALEGMKRIAPDALHTIEAPPVGNCTLTDARAALGDTILIGNIQYDDLARQRPEKLEEMVKAVIDEGRSGRFILSPTAGPYEDSIGERMQENYLRFMETGFRYGTLRV